MAQRLICARGHQWDFDREKEAAPGMSPSSCPVCGAPPLGPAGMPAAHAQSDTIEFEDQGEEPRIEYPAPTTESQGSLADTRRIPGYEILETLGQGGMGVVYKARQVGLNRLVALKQLRPGVGARPEDVARFRVEAEAIARIDHPHIVQIYEIGEVNGLPYFSLEFCPGGSLAARLPIHGGALPPKQGAQLVEKLAQAIQAAHQAQVIHGDLKPANVLLSAAGEPKIGDFGLARQLDRDQGETTGTWGIIGTPSYMAPEQAAGQPIGPGADVYALGAILYELLTGRPPHRAPGAFETLRQVLAEEPLPPSRIQPGIPDDLERICLRCLRKEPQQRFASAAALAEALRTAQTQGLEEARTEQAFRQLNGRFQALLLALSDAVLLADSTGRLVQTNPAADLVLGATVTGLTLESWLARDLFVLVDRQRCTLADFPLTRALRGETVEEVELFVRPAARPEGLWVRLSARPLPGGPDGGAVLVIRDVTKEKAEHEAEVLYQSLVEGLPLNIFRKDLEGRFTFVNSTFCKTIRKPAEEILGQTDFALFPEARAEKYQRDDRRLIQSGGVFEDIEEHLSSACGPCCRCGGVLSVESDATLVEPRRYIQVLLALVYDPSGQVIGTQGAFWPVTARMLTELKKKSSDLERANAELARSVADLEQFAYVASHDLQEPLRMVASYTQLLQRRYQGKLDKNADEFIAFAVDGATRMQGLINDLLSYSRVATRSKPLQETLCNAAFDQAIQNLEAAIQEKGAVVTRGDLPKVWADSTQMIQLFQNLIANGIKFCRYKTPIVKVSAVLNGDEWLFAVSDNGIGIEPGHTERIFAIFQRLHTREQYAGTGIGLAICKKIVERHGGRIWVQSEPGHGSTFYFTLRLEWFDARD